MEAKKQNKRGLSARHALHLGHRLAPMPEFVRTGRLIPREAVGATVGEGPQRSDAGRGARVSK